MKNFIYLLTIMAMAIGFPSSPLQAETGREVIMNARVQDFSWDSQFNMYRNTVRLNSQDSVYYIKSEKYAKEAGEPPVEIKEYQYIYDSGMKVGEKRYTDTKLLWEIQFEYNENGIIQRRDTIEHLVGHKISLRSEIFDYSDDYYTIIRQKQYYMADGELQDEVKSMQELRYNYLDELIYENNWTYDKVLDTIRNHVISEELEPNFFVVRTYEYENNLFEPVDSTFNLKRFDNNYRLIENYNIWTDEQVADTVIRTKRFYTYNENGDMLSYVTYVPYRRDTLDGQILYKYDTSAAEIYDYDVTDFDYKKINYSSFIKKDEDDYIRQIPVPTNTIFYRNKSTLFDGDTLRNKYTVQIRTDINSSNTKHYYFDEKAINDILYYQNETRVDQATQDTIADYNTLDLKITRSGNSLQFSGTKHQHYYTFQHGQLIEEYRYICEAELRYDNNKLVHQKSRVYNDEIQQYEWTHDFGDSYRVILRDNSAEQKLIHHFNTMIDNRINESGIYYLNREFEDDRPIRDTLITETNSSYDFDKALIKIDYEHRNLDDISSVAKTSDMPQYSIYPNPASDIITIKDFVSSVDISALDVLGRSYPLRALNAGSDLVLNISDLRRGIYFINLNGKMMSFIKK